MKKVALLVIMTLALAALTDLTFWPTLKAVFLALTITAFIALIMEMCLLLNYLKLKNRP